MLTLYQSEWCPACHRVRQVLTELGLTYIGGERRRQPRRARRRHRHLRPGHGARPAGRRQGLHRLRRDDRVLAGDVPRPRRRGGPRRLRLPGELPARSSLPPRAALAHLRELLEAKGFAIVAQIRGPKINERLPKEYVLLYVTIPVAAVKTSQIDPLAPGALLLPMAVMPADGGGSVIATADPVGQVWLYGEPELNSDPVQGQGAARRGVRGALRRAARAGSPATYSQRNTPQAEQRRDQADDGDDAELHPVHARARSRGPPARSRGGRAAAPCRCPPSSWAAGRAAPTCPRRTA